MFRYTSVPVARVFAVSVAAAVLLGGAAASADPVRLVTSGHADQLVEDGETSFRFIGDGFDFNGEVSWRPSETCGPCAPGTTVDVLTATMSPNVFPPGSATIDGRSYDTVYFSGSWNVEASPLTVPNVPAGSPGVFRSSPFTFSGTLSGYADASLTGTPLFSTQLAGGGTASIGFFHYPTAPVGTFTDGFNYVFLDTAPVPEPGSLLLFGSGGAWLAARWRGRRRQSAA